MRLRTARGFLFSWLPVLLWAAMIVGASNDSLSSVHTRGWLETALGRGAPEWLNVAIRKLGHLTEYGILAALTLRAGWRTWGRTRISFTFGLLVPLLVASIDETRQSFTRFRTGSFWDVVLDFLGACLVVSLSGLVAPSGGLASAEGTEGDGGDGERYEG